MLIDNYANESFRIIWVRFFWKTVGWTIRSGYDVKYVMYLLALTSFCINDSLTYNWIWIIFGVCDKCKTFWNRCGTWWVEVDKMKNERRQTYEWIPLWALNLNMIILKLESKFDTFEMFKCCIQSKNLWINILKWHEHITTSISRSTLDDTTLDPGFWTILQTSSPSSCEVMRDCSCLRARSGDNIMATNVNGMYLLLILKNKNLDALSCVLQNFKIFELCTRWSLWIVRTARTKGIRLKWIICTTIWTCVQKMKYVVPVLTMLQSANTIVMRNCE